MRKIAAPGRHPKSALDGFGEAPLKSGKILGHGLVGVDDARRLDEDHGRIGRLGLDPRANAGQVGDDRRAAAGERLYDDERKPLEK